MLVLVDRDNGMAFEEAYLVSLEKRVGRFGVCVPLSERISFHALVGIRLLGLTLSFNTLWLIRVKSTRSLYCKDREIRSPGIAEHHHIRVT